MKESILDRYIEILYDTEGIEAKFVYPFARELTRRQHAGWRIPDSTYRRCKDVLYYKESLERPSPYYVDLFKIENIDNLKSVLYDLFITIKFLR